MELQKCQKICENGMIMSFEEEIAMFQENTYFVFKPENCKKIIATTDNSLGLPQPSEEFIKQWIEEYNKGNVITDVKVEYEEYKISQTEWFQEAPYICKYDVTELKVNLNNSINIKLLQPTLYTKEEVIELIHSICGEMYKRNTIYSPTSVDKWLKENL